jgi:plasmid maintenance system antidote protein VapI
MIRRDITVPELAEAIGVTRQYASAIVNGRVIAEPAVKKISDYLGISDQYDENGSV